MNGGMNAAGVVKQDGAGLGVVELELGEHDGHVAIDELIEDRLFLAEGHHGHAVHFALEHAADAGGKHGGVAVGGTDEDFVSVGDGYLFKAADQFREEGIGDVFNDDAEQAAFAGDEGACVGVGKVVELLDSLPDAFGKTLADQRRTVDGSRDGGD